MSSKLLSPARSWATSYSYSGSPCLPAGLKYERQKLNQTAAGMGASLLLLAAVGLIIPALFHFTAVERGVAVERELSLTISFILFASYVASLLFTLKTHHHLFAGEAHNASDLGEQPWTRRASITVLTVVACLVALMSEMLVGVAGASCAATWAHASLRRRHSCQHLWGMRPNIPRP